MNKYTCPRCGSSRVNTLRTTVGPMWCQDCGYRVEHKENKPNPFTQGRTISVITRDDDDDDDDALNGGTISIITRD